VRISPPARHNHSPAWPQMTLGGRSSPLRGEVGRSRIGALLPVADDAAYGRRCPAPAVRHPHQDRFNWGRSCDSFFPPLVGRGVQEPAIGEVRHGRAGIRHHDRRFLTSPPGTQDLSVGRGDRGCSRGELFSRNKFTHGEEQHPDAL